MASQCLDHNLHILVEKPLTLDHLEAQILIDKADSAGLVLMVGHTFEFNNAVRTLKNLMESGEIGQVYYLDCARLNLGLFQNGLNVLWDLAPHDLSILLYLLDQEPISVSAQGMSCVTGSIHDVVYMNLVFPGDILAHVHVSWLDPRKVRRVTVVGSRKMVVYNDIESLEKIKIYDKGVEAPDYTTSFGDFQYSYRYGDVLIPSIKFTEPLRVECHHFLDCIRNGVQPITDGRNGQRVVRILEAAQRSLMKNGQMEPVS
jgi:predicted dehydrogenase